MKAMVISSFAEDRIIYGSKKVLKKGGPARFITQVLKKLRMPYQLICNDEGIVEIDMRNNMEKGRIISTSKILCQMQNKAEIVLISTLLDEFDLKAFGKFCCVDLQGYVRDGSDFGKKRAFDSEELEKFDVVKVTKYEVQYIPKDRVKRLKTLVITDGEKGFEVIQEGNRQKFTIKRKS